MKSVRILMVIFFIALSVTLIAQAILPVPRNISDAFKKGTRNMNGKPGTQYWQNHATYDISIHFNPASRLISGTVDILYTNNSPDTLNEIVFKLYPNIYKGGAMRVFPIDEEDVSKGMAVEKITINNTLQNPGASEIFGTNMTVPLQPLAPTQQVHFTIEYSYILNEGSHLRTGEIEEGAYFIAYSFPRIAVYDDIDGWNKAQYLGTYEFYNDFCDFKVSVTVPQNFAVWATGDFVNCSEVFTDKICQRIKAAEQNDGYIYIIDSTDLAKRDVTLKNPTSTFRFEAKQVTDFTFALSDHYVWQSTSLIVDKSTGRRTRVDAVFNPAHKEYYKVLHEAAKTVEFMSYAFPKWPYPYNHETVFDGLDEMEYPMMVNDIPVEDTVESFGLTSHEIFHTMFPFYMGINETKYGWMDEGWATIGEWLLTPMFMPGVVDTFGIAGYEASAGKDIDLPVMTPTTQLQGIYYEDASAFAVNSYPKPGLGYLYVKDMLGDELFFKALHNYINNWKGKHPMPYDFFNSMNEGAGINLNWFWKAWYFDNGYPDLAFATVKAGKNQYQITVESKGSKPVPVDINVYYNDGTAENIHRSVEVWEKGNKTVNLSFSPSKAVTKIVLGSSHVPDVNKTDNVWMNK